MFSPLTQQLASTVELGSTANACIKRALPGPCASIRTLVPPRARVCVAAVSTNVRTPGNSCSVQLSTRLLPVPVPLPLPLPCAEKLPLASLGAGDSASTSRVLSGATTKRLALDVQEKIQSAPTPPVESQHSCQPTVKLHILPLLVVWNFPPGKGWYGGAGGSSWRLPWRGLGQVDVRGHHACPPLVRIIKIIIYIIIITSSI